MEEACGLIEWVQWFKWCDQAPPVKRADAWARESGEAPAGAGASRRRLSARLRGPSPHREQTLHSTCPPKLEGTRALMYGTRWVLTTPSSQSGGASAAQRTRGSCSAAASAGRASKYEPRIPGKYLAVAAASCSVKVANEVMRAVAGTTSS